MTVSWKNKRDLAPRYAEVGRICNDDSNSESDSDEYEEIERSAAQIKYDREQEELLFHQIVVVGTYKMEFEVPECVKPTPRHLIPAITEAHYVLPANERKPFVPPKEEVPIVTYIDKYNGMQHAEINAVLQGILDKHKNDRRDMSNLRGSGHHSALSSTRSVPIPSHAPIMPPLKVVDYTPTFMSLAVKNFPAPIYDAAKPKPAPTFSADGEQLFDDYMRSSPADIEAALVPLSEGGQPDYTDDDEQYIFDYGDQNAHEEEWNPQLLVSPDPRPPTMRLRLKPHLVKPIKSSTDLPDNDDEFEKDKTKIYYGGVYEEDVPERSDNDYEVYADADELKELDWDHQKSDIHHKSSLGFAESHSMAEERNANFHRQKMFTGQREFYRDYIEDSIQNDHTFEKSRTIIRKAGDIVNASNSMSDPNLNAAQLNEKMAQLCSLPSISHPDTFDNIGNPGTTIDGGCGSDLQFELPPSLHKPRHMSSRITPASQEYNIRLESAMLHINNQDPMKQVKPIYGSTNHHHHHQNEIVVTSEPSQFDSQKPWKHTNQDHPHPLEPFNNNLYDSDGNFIPPPHNFFNINFPAPVISFNDIGHAQIHDNIGNYNQNHNNYDIDQGIEFRSRNRESIYINQGYPSDQLYHHSNMYYPLKDKPYIHNHPNTFNQDTNYSNKNNGSQDNTQIIPYKNSDYNFRQTNYGNSGNFKNYNNYWNNKHNNICRPNIPRYPFQNHRPFNQNNQPPFYNRFHNNNQFNSNIRNNIHMQGSFKSVNNEHTKYNNPSNNKFPQKNEGLRNINAPFNVEENNAYSGVPAYQPNNNPNHPRQSCPPNKNNINNKPQQKNMINNNSSQKKPIFNNQPQKKNIFNNSQQKPQIFNTSPQKKSTFNQPHVKKPLINTPPNKKLINSSPIKKNNNSPSQKNNTFNQEISPIKNTFNKQQLQKSYNKSPIKKTNDHYNTTPPKNSISKPSPKNLYGKNKTFGVKTFNVTKKLSPMKNISNNRSPIKQQVISKSPIHNNISPRNDFNPKQKNNQRSPHSKYKKDQLLSPRYTSNLMNNPIQQSDMYDNNKNKLPKFNKNVKMGVNNFNKMRSNCSIFSADRANNSHYYADDNSTNSNDSHNTNQNNSNISTSTTLSREIHMKPVAAIYDCSKRSGRRPDRPLFIPQAVRMLQRANVLIGDSNIPARSLSSRESIVKDKLDGFGVKVAEETPIAKKRRFRKTSMSKSISQITSIDEDEQVQEIWETAQESSNNTSQITPISADEDIFESWPSTPPSEIGDNRLEASLSEFEETIYKTPPISLTPTPIQKPFKEPDTSSQSIYVTPTYVYCSPIPTIDEDESIKQLRRNLKSLKAQKENFLHDSVSANSSNSSLHKISSEMTTRYKNRTSTPTPNQMSPGILQISNIIDSTDDATFSSIDTISIDQRHKKSNRKHVQPYRATGRNFRKNDSIQDDAFAKKAIGLRIKKLEIELGNKIEKEYIYKKKKYENALKNQKLNSQNSIDIEIPQNENKTLKDEELNNLSESSVDVNGPKTITNNLTEMNSNSKDEKIEIVEKIGGLSDDDNYDDRHHSFIELTR